MAIAGSEVAITVESMFSMKSATARMSGMMRFKGSALICLYDSKPGLGASRHARAVITHWPGCRIKLLSLLCDRSPW